MKMPLARLLTSTLALTLVAAAVPAAHANPLANALHLHPHAAQTDDRVQVTLLNAGESFKEVTVDGKTYTVMAHRTLTIKAPVGTVIYAGCGVPLHKKGSVLFEVNAAVNNATVKIA